MARYTIKNYTVRNYELKGSTLRHLKKWEYQRGTQETSYKELSKTVADSGCGRWWVGGL